MRFECFADPCGAWIVWDLKRDSFASLDGIDLMALSRRDAQEACALLNAMPTRKARRARMTRLVHKSEPVGLRRSA